jgi:type VI secretion system protein ImpC
MSDSAFNRETAAPVAVETGSLLDQVVSATKQTEPDRAQDLVRTLVEQAYAGTVTFDRNLTRTIERAIAVIDQKLSDQLN